jgi:hypothetical protein
MARYRARPRIQLLEIGVWYGKSLIRLDLTWYRARPRIQLLEIGVWYGQSLI